MPRAGHPPPSIGDDEAKCLVEMHAALIALKAAARHPGAARPACARMLKAVRRASAVARWRRTVPVLDLDLRRGAAGGDIARELGRSRLPPPLRPVLAVLTMPDGGKAYLVGRSRQAVRTNRTRALDNGFEARETTDRDLIERCVERLGDAGVETYQLDAVRMRSETGLGRFWTVIDPYGEPCALASVSVDVEVARVNAVLVVPSDDASPARYLLASQIFLDLAAEPVRHVVTDRIRLTSPGVLYLQHRLGYEPRRVRLNYLP